MPHLSLNYFRAAAIFLVVGVAIGLQMSISGEHNVTGAHTHVNLLGWVSSAIFATYFALDPEKAQSILAKLQFWIVTISAALMSGALYFLLLGYTAMIPVLAVASLAWGIGALVFTWIVFSPRRRDSVSTPE